VNIHGLFVTDHKKVILKFNYLNINFFIEIKILTLFPKYEDILLGDKQLFLHINASHRVVFDSMPSYIVILLFLL
jgi:hypothetical protein